MTKVTETIIINGSKETIEAINKKIKEQGGSQTQVTERKNLDGSVTTWIVVATLANQSLPHILNFIKECINRKSVESVKVGDIEIKNPTAKMIDDIEKILESRSNNLGTNE